jgi:hypothetical protein
VHGSSILHSIKKHKKSFRYMNQARFNFMLAMVVWLDHQAIGVTACCRCSSTQLGIDMVVWTGIVHCMHPCGSCSCCLLIV